YLDDKTGLFDTSKLSEMLASRGLAHLAPDLLKPVESINDSITKHQKLQQELNNSTAVMYGDIANGVQQARQKLNMPIDQALDLVAQPALVTGRIDRASFERVKAQLLALPPDQQDAALSSYMDSASQISGDETLGKDAVKLDRYGRVKVKNVATKPVTSAELEQGAMQAYARAADATRSGGQPTAEDQATITGWEKTHPHPDK